VLQAPLEGEGVITKAIDLGPDLAAGVLAGTYSLNSVVYVCEGVVDVPDCNALTDPAVVAHGGFDDFGGGFTWEFSVDVPAGQYTICSAADVTGDFDGDGVDDTIGYAFVCESEGPHSVQPIGAAPVIDRDGPFFVFDGLETYVPNDFEAMITGQLDVYVRDELTDLPLPGAEVCLYSEVDGVLTQIACAITDAAGLASFADVPAGTYVTNASAVNYEDEASALDYSPIDDAFNGGIVDDAATADSIHALDPAGAMLGVQVTLNGVAVGAGVVVNLYDEFCTVLVATGATDATGLAEFGVAPGTYCAGSDPGGNTIETLTGAFAVAAGDPAGDIDATINENTGVLGVSVDDQVVSGRNTVELYLANAADVYGGGGSCAGAFITSGVTTLIGGDDVALTDIDFVDLTAEGSTTYCVFTYPGDGFAPGADVQSFTLADADPAGDVDVSAFPN
jgi:hypothetical protein